VSGTDLHVVDLATRRIRRLTVAMGRTFGASWR
jgi:hypothetical protein